MNKELSQRNPTIIDRKIHEFNIEIEKLIKTNKNVKEQNRIFQKESQIALEQNQILKTELAKLNTEKEQLIIQNNTLKNYNKELHSDYENRNRKLNIQNNELIEKNRRTDEILNGERKYSRKNNNRLLVIILILVFILVSFFVFKNEILSSIDSIIVNNITKKANTPIIDLISQEQNISVAESISRVPLINTDFLDLYVKNKEICKKIWVNNIDVSNDEKIRLETSDMDSCIINFINFNDEAFEYKVFFDKPEVLIKNKEDIKVEKEVKRNLENKFANPSTNIPKYIKPIFEIKKEILKNSFDSTIVEEIIKAKFAYSIDTLNFSYTDTITDYKKGYYDIANSRITKTLADAVIYAVDSLFTNYLEERSSIRFSLIGVSDANPITGHLFYNEEYGELRGRKSKLYYFNGTMKRSNLALNDTINNETLALLRAIGVQEYLSIGIYSIVNHNADFFLTAMHDRINKGNEYRRVEIEVTIIQRKKII